TTLSDYYSLVILLIRFIFFFSSRRRHTRFKCDWSSDVCSSDLSRKSTADIVIKYNQVQLMTMSAVDFLDQWFETDVLKATMSARSEERRVGKECRSRWGGDQRKRKRVE